MDGKRWYQIRWNAERTDNISAADLEDAYAQAWHIGDRELESGMYVDSQTIDIEDMVSGKTYRVPVEYLEAGLDDGWGEFSRGLHLSEPVLNDVLDATRIV